MTTPVSIQSLVNALTISLGVVALLAAVPAECIDPGDDLPSVTQTTGSISGTVSDAETGAGIRRCAVLALRSASGPLAGYTMCSATGAYQLSGLDPASYVVYVESHERSPSYLDEYYESQIAWSLGGDSSTWPLTPVAVEAGQDTGGIDFVLDRGGVISGSIAAAGDGPAIDFSYLRVEVVHATTGIWDQYGVDLHDGTFQAYGLETGNYVVYTKGDQRLVNEVYDDHPCEALVDCDPAEVGDPVPAVRSSETSGIDFLLDRGGWISGSVRHGFTGEPLTATVDVFHLDGTLAAGGRQLGGGDWETWQDYGLAAGPYLVRASTGVGGVWLYGNVHCPGCDPSCVRNCAFPPSTPVIVTLGQETSGIEITVMPSGGIFGDGFESSGLERWSTSTP